MGLFRYGDKISFLKDVPLTISNETKVIEKEVIKYIEVPVEKVITVVKEIPVEVVKEVKVVEEKLVEVIKEVPVEVVKIEEKIIEKPVEKLVEIIKEIPTEVKVVEEKIINVFHIPMWCKIIIGLQSLVIITLLIIK